MDRFTDSMWSEIAGTYRAILDLPFNRELAAGTLRRERFLFYMVQDAHYLGVFSRALALVAAKAPEAQGQVSFARAAEETITVERALHDGFFGEFGVTPELFRRTPRSPTCTAYCNFLLAAAWGQPYPVGVATVLPCFQIYWEVGKELHGRATRPNPYQAWIDTYVDDGFGRTVQAALDFADAAHAEASDGDRELMREAYLTAVRYEWMFWESAYRRETWPV
jgi:thiaminase (transcriptional activator TenA)